MIQALQMVPKADGFSIQAIGKSTYVIAWNGPQGWQYRAMVITDSPEEFDRALRLHAANAREELSNG